MQPRVSVVMPVYRPSRLYLREAIDSVLAQTLADWELVIVEDPSEFLGRDLIASYADSRIRYVLNDARTGLAQQHNRAVAESRAPLVARFDADDVCEPDRLVKQVEFLNSHPDIDIVASQLTIIDGVGKVIAQRNYPLVHDEILRAMHLYNPISGSNATFRRRIVDEVGGWREGVDRPAQDYEWYSRVAARGFRFAIHPGRLVRYRRHSGQIKANQLRGTIATTLEVKRLYWRRTMSPGAWLRYGAEHVLLALPTPLVLWLLRQLLYRHAG